MRNRTLLNSVIARPKLQWLEGQWYCFLFEKLNINANLLELSSSKFQDMMRTAIRVTYGTIPYGKSEQD